MGPANPIRYRDRPSDLSLASMESTTLRFTLSTLLAVSLGACADDAQTPAEPGTTTAEGSTSADDGADETTTTAGIEGDYEPDCAAEFEILDADPNFPWSPLSIELVSEQITPDVFVTYDARAPQLGPDEAPMATSGGFVIGEDGVLLVESMMNQQLACQMVELVREQTDLPILYIVNTSHHGDHSYGNHYFGADTQIVQHEATAEFIDSDFFEPDRQWMIDNFGAGQGIEQVEPRTADVQVSDEGWSVDLGGITVEAHHFGFAQTHGDLFVYLPDQHVVWTGNAQVTGNPGLPWLLDGRAEESRATMQALREFLPADALVVPGHDTPQPVDTFDFTIDYLDALMTQVGAAVDQGLTLEETIASVTMEEFRGYVLFDWVHPVINVTNTYADLTGQ